MTGPENKSHVWTPPPHPPPPPPPSLSTIPPSAILSRIEPDSIAGEQQALENVPNAFTYERVVETERAAYLVRPYLYSSLYDRIRFLCPPERIAQHNL